MGCTESRMLSLLIQKVVSLDLDTITMKAYLCNQGGGVSLFPPE